MPTGSSGGGTAVTADQLWALIPAGWRAAIDRTLEAADLELLATRLSSEPPSIVPTDRGQWFRALAVTPLDGVRAVILGQDPYPNPELAEGLAFSVPNGARRVPPSLRRILVETQRVAMVADGRTSLLPWARRGVLLMNTALTVPKGKAGGHAEEWRPVTDAILRAVASQPWPVAFMPWGDHAKAAVKGAKIANGRPHIVDPSVHPMQRKREFISSNPFGRVNDRLKELGVATIDWSLD